MKPVLPDSDPTASKDCVFEAVGLKKEFDGGLLPKVHRGGECADPDI
jgi:hypothetical protein